MTTRETIQEFFDRLEEQREWESLLSDDIVFTSLTSPVESVSGKDACLQATQPFYSTVKAMEVRDLLVDGERACALTRYEVQPPNGAATFQSDVAEIFTVRDGRIASFSIYFDPSPYPK
jgi:ketosteroid isomerase-like protein